ncbi:MAG: hypothetical protein HKN26_00365 [Acidimicrobiales bacterium]|nr:hypothetical protein [Acidimicrobiales bacterium]
MSETRSLPGAPTCPEGALVAPGTPDCPAGSVYVDGKCVRTGPVEYLCHGLPVTINMRTGACGEGTSGTT